MKTIIFIFLLLQFGCNGQTYTDTDTLPNYEGVQLPYYPDTDFDFRSKDMDKQIDSSKLLGYNDNQAIEFDTIPITYKAGQGVKLIDSDNTITILFDDDYISQDTQLVLGGKYIKDIYYPDPEYLNNENLIRDNCGQWWERNIEYGEWRNKPAKFSWEIYDVTMSQAHTIGSKEFECNSPTVLFNYEYRLDKTNMIEYSRTVKVTYKKIEL